MNGLIVFCFLLLSCFGNAMDSTDSSFCETCEKKDPQEIVQDQLCGHDYHQRCFKIYVRQWKKKEIRKQCIKQILIFSAIARDRANDIEEESSKQSSHELRKQLDSIVMDIYAYMWTMDQLKKLQIEYKPQENIAVRLSKESVNEAGEIIQELYDNLSVTTIQTKSNQFIDLLLDFDKTFHEKIDIDRRYISLTQMDSLAKDIQLLCHSRLHFSYQQPDEVLKLNIRVTKNILAAACDSARGKFYVQADKLIKVYRFFLQHQNKIDASERNVDLNQFRNVHGMIHSQLNHVNQSQSFKLII